MRGSFGEGDSHGNDVVIRRLGWRSVGFYYFQGGGGDLEVPRVRIGIV